MEKKSKILLSIFIIILAIGLAALILLLYIFGSVLSAFRSCGNSSIHYTSGDFVYTIEEIKEEDGSVKKYANIRPTFSFYEKEIMIIPEYLDGYPVYIYLKLGAFPKNEHIKKIYIKSGLFNSSNTTAIAFKMNGEYKIIFTSIENRVGFTNCTNYYLKETFLNRDFEHRHCDANNVNYYYNYENSPNGGYYWTDVYEDGERITYIPQEPTREGYIFDGWYKEPECVNKWNFDIDTVQKEDTIYTDFENTYKENALYAKWIEL